MNTPTYEGETLRNEGFIRELLNRAPSTHSYRVEKPSTASWPEDHDLINFCDNGTSHFGGHVSYIAENVALVIVYVD